MDTVGQLARRAMRGLLAGSDEGGDPLSGATAMLARR